MCDPSRSMEEEAAMFSASRDAPVPSDDPRDRMRSPYHRVVAPNAQRRGQRVFINGPLVVERSFKDSKGVEGWIVVKRWESRPKASEDGELEVALYTLLSNGAE